MKKTILISLMALSFNAFSQNADSSSYDLANPIFNVNKAEVYIEQGLNATQKTEVTNMINANNVLINSELAKRDVQIADLYAKLNALGSGGGSGGSSTTSNAGTCYSGSGVLSIEAVNNGRGYTMNYYCTVNGVKRKL